MTTVDTRPSRGTVNGSPVGSSGSPVGGRRRRSVPHLVIGALLVVSVALAAAVLEARRDLRVAVLGVSHPVAAGQVLAAGDLRVVRIVPDPAVRTVDAAQLGATVGRTAAVPLAAGSLLSPTQVGPAAWPPAGQAVVAVAVKSGHAPAGLVEGSRVSAIVVPTAATGTGDASRVVRAEGSVVSVQPAADQQGVTVVSLLLADDAATAVASASGEVSLVLRAAG